MVSFQGPGGAISTGFHAQIQQRQAHLCAPALYNVVEGCAVVEIGKLDSPATFRNQHELIGAT